jgi:tRNA (cytosine34-C5)-methyltransferase
MWPPKPAHVTKLGKRIKGPPLERCMRLMPHDQDMVKRCRLNQVDP